MRYPSQESLISQRIVSYYHKLAVWLATDPPIRRSKTRQYGDWSGDFSQTMLKLANQLEMILSHPLLAGAI